MLHQTLPLCPDTLWHKRLVSRNESLPRRSWSLSRSSGHPRMLRPQCSLPSIAHSITATGSRRREYQRHCRWPLTHRSCKDVDLRLAGASALLLLTPLAHGIRNARVPLVCFVVAVDVRVRRSKSQGCSGAWTSAQDQFAARFFDKGFFLSLLSIAQYRHSLSAPSNRREIP